MSPCVPYELQRGTWRVFYVLLKRSGTPVWHEPIGFGASGRAGLTGLYGVSGGAERSWGDLETTMCSRETLGCLHQSSVTHVGRRDPADGKGLIGLIRKPTGTRSATGTMYRSLMMVLSTVKIIAIIAMPQRGETSDGLIPPLAHVTWCLGAASTSEGCGQAIAGRTEWNNDWCNRTARLRTGELSLSNALRGAVLDIILVPAEDETLWLGSSFGGLVGDVLNELARNGGFTWNAFVVRPPQTGDAYGGSWNNWMVDWVNRADLVAAWMYDNAARRENGISFPHSFYELSPVLVVANLGQTEQAWWQGDLMAFLQPFSAELYAYNSSGAP
jgi:hypothetical protein